MEDFGMSREAVARWLVQHAEAVVSFLVVSVAPVVYWIHRHIRGGIVDEAHKADDARGKHVDERFNDVEVRLVRLEDGENSLREDVQELRRDTKEVRLQLNNHGERLASIAANVEAIKHALNGARRPE